MPLRALRSGFQNIGGDGFENTFRDGKGDGVIGLSFWKGQFSLSERDVIEVRNGLTHTTPGHDSEFAILEPEAVAVALDCAASGPPGAIVVPQWGAPFTASDAEAILAGKPGSPERWDSKERHAGPLFPAESIETGDSTGPLRAVVGALVNSPIAVADELVWFRQLREVAPDARRDWVELATASLYHISGSDAKVEIDPGLTREREKM